MKEKIHIEYGLKNISLSVLWTCLSNPSGLAGWFADDVSITEKIYTFTWGDTKQDAELLAIRTGYYIRFHWVDDEDEKSYFEFKINPDELTGDVTLIVTDFIYPEDKKDTIELWNKQIDELKRKAGM